ncbi:hypothetical protein [Citricoccus muralis]|uniref:Orn/DAP/Arg decarboxylase 2 N-terminal domain-containing protein n=1 Tax=Citricoccus muralis TaxID=169134 RepID=A0ABY8H8K3_9MICC|nr:hypothetical protein [Citricoccus muralis]WFP17159.1 hypothetical protein P8192_03260 [Citricoccus muralis]
MEALEPTSGPAPPTPFFVIDVDILDRFVDRFQRALRAHWPNSILSYSMKTNSLPWLITRMRQHGVWAEVVSDTEYELAQKLGYAEDEIVYNGPLKSRELLRQALGDGSIVNLDAQREVDWSVELAQDHPELEIRVGLRVNWDLAARCQDEHGDGDDGSRFGFNTANGDLDEVISRLREVGVVIAGLHLHRTSRTQSLDVYRAAATVAAELVEEHELSLDWIDIGGGFFGGDDASPSFDDYIAAIRATLDDVVDTEATQLIVEPGGSLIAVPVEFHASVVDVKEIDGRTIVVTDASRTNIDPLFRRQRVLDVRLESASNQTHPEQIISGFTCMEDDRITKLHNRAELEPEDRLVFGKVGAYTMCFQPLFIEYLPAVYARQGDSLSLVRRKWGIDDFLQGNYWNEDDVHARIVGPAESTSQATHHSSAVLTGRR